MKIEIYGGKEMAYNLGVFGCPCTYKHYKFSTTATWYYFAPTGNRFTPKSIENAVERLGTFMGINLSVRNTVDGFAVGIKKQPHEIVYPSLSAVLDKVRYNNGDIPLGIDDDGGAVAMSIGDCPHLLVAGQTGSGKTVYLNSLISTLILNNDTRHLQLVLIDVKRVEFSRWKNNKFLLTPVVVDTDRAVVVLNTLVAEMERRFAVMEKHGVEKDDGTLFPRIVVVIDELADLMLSSKKAVEEPIVRLAQKSRACGIHLVVGTQRPTVNVVSGLIKANIPTRLAFAMASVKDSVIMLDHKGAEKLAGKGDCIIKYADGEELHLQAPFISNEEMERIAEASRSVGKPTKLKLKALLSNLLGRKREV